MAPILARAARGIISNVFIVALLAEYAAAEVVSSLKAAGATGYLDLIKASGAQDALAKSSPMMGPGLVVLAPTNAAVDAWLKGSGGLKMGDLMDRKALVQRVVGYQTLFPSTALTKLKAGSATSIATANPTWNITVTRAADGKITALDTHNQMAVLTPTSSPNVFLVDRVLLPGNVFPSLGQMGFKNSMGGPMMQPFSLFQAALSRAGMMEEVKTMGTTTFVPTDEAFAAAGLTRDAIAKADPAALRSVLLYHSISGYRPIPKGFKSGIPVPTMLKGYDVTVKLAETPMSGGYMMGHATVKDATGNVAQVVAPNYFTGASTIHGIDKVLAYKPSTASKGAGGGMAMAMATAAGGTHSMGAGMMPKTAPAAGARRLLLSNPAAAGGRRALLQRNDPSSDPVTLELATQNARDAVLAAVNSDSPDGAFHANRLASINAQYIVYPSTRSFYLLGAGGGLNGRR